MEVLTVRIGVYQLAETALSLKRYFDALKPRLEALGNVFIPYGTEGPMPRDLDLYWDPFCAGGSFPTRLPDPHSGIPFVVTLHGAAPLSLPHQENYPNLLDALHGEREVQRRVEYWLEHGNQITHLICPSAYARDELHRVLGLPLDRITPIAHGIDQSVFNQEGPAMTNVGFLHVSAYQTKKNVNRLIEAYQDLDCDSKPPLTLILPGFALKDVPAGVHVIGESRDANTLAAYYRGALAFVFPSLHETFGFPVAEAMACGCPVITSQGSALEELYEGAAWLVDPRDRAVIRSALCTLALDRDCRDRLIQAGLARVRNLTWENSAQRHYEIFSQHNVFQKSNSAHKSRIIGSAMSDGTRGDPLEAVKGRPVCVLGMHRSGTSLVSRVLNLLGVHLGPEQHLMKANVDNPKGYWEHQLITNLNDEILVRLGGSWHEPPIFLQGWQHGTVLSDIRQRARRLIQDDFAAAQNWGWKDPRTCLTLPFWQTLVSSPKYILCLRNPIDVAQSLQRRNGFPFEKSMRLWLAHVNAALEQTAVQERMIIFYEDLILDWRTELKRLAQFLGTAEVAEEEEEIQARVGNFIAGELQHHRTSFVDTVDDDQLFFPVKALYMVLRLYRGVDSGASVERALEVFSQYALSANKELDALTVEKGEQLKQLTDERDRLVQEVDEFRVTIQSQQQALGEKEEHLAQLAAERNRFALEKTQREHQVSELTAEREQFAREADRLRSIMQSQAEELVAIKDTIGYRALSKYRAIRERFGIIKFLHFSLTRPMKRIFPKK